jgi:hypothetical protein
MVRGGQLTREKAETLKVENLKPETCRNGCGATAGQANLKAKGERRNQ